MKKILTLLIALTITIASQAQKTEIKFSEKSHFFGNIPEKEGEVECKFTYTNIGTAPLVINEIRTGCNCTTSQWDKESLAPGQKGTLTVIFDPEGLSGKFVKSIAVFTNTTPSVQNLTIRGYVIPQKNGPFDNFPIKLGHIRMDSDSVNMQTLNQGNTYIKDIQIINSSKEEVDLQAEIATKGIEAQITPARLAPLQQGKITISWETNDKTPIGPIIDEIKIIQNGQLAGAIPTVADIHDNFSMYKGNYTNAPFMQIDHNEYDFGAIANGVEIAHELLIRNNGKSELQILKTVCNDPNVSVEMKKGIKAGKSRKMVLTVKSNDQPSLRCADILLYTNDPQNPVVPFTLYYEIN